MPLYPIAPIPAPWALALEEIHAMPCLDMSKTDLARKALSQKLLELEYLEATQAKRRKEKGISYFIPNSPQLRAMRNPAREVIFVAGNRSGKSTAGATQLAHHLTRQYPECSCHGPWYPKKKRFTYPIKAVVVATEYPIIERTIEPKILSYLPKEWIASTKRTPQGYLRRITGKDGGTIDILSGEMDQMAFESADWDFAWIDEPTGKNKYIAIHRGLLDRRGLSILTFTPLIEPWMKEELVDKVDGRLRDVVQASTYDNMTDIHGSPVQSKQAISELEAIMPEEERRVRIEGEFFHMRGRVYTEFSHGVHTYEDNPQQSRLYQYPDPVFCVLDPHDRQPHHLIWAYLDRLDNIYVDREVVFQGTITELSKKVLMTELQAGYRVRARFIDPNFGQKPLLMTGRTVRQELAGKPFPVGFGLVSDDKEAGHSLVKQYLHFDRNKPLGFTNSPKLFFNRSRCPVTIRSMKNYQYDEWRGKLRDQKDPKELPKQKDTHGADCIRYLVMANPRFDSLQKQTQNSQLVEAPY